MHLYSGVFYIICFMNGGLGLFLPCLLLFLLPLLRLSKNCSLCVWSTYFYLFSVFHIDFLVFILLKTLIIPYFSIHGIHNTLLQYHTLKASILVFLSFSITYISAPYRASLHTKLFTIALFVSRYRYCICAKKIPIFIKGLFSPVLFYFCFCMASSYACEFTF